MIVRGAVWDALPQWSLPRIGRMTGAYFSVDKRIGLAAMELAEDRPDDSTARGRLTPL